MVSWSWQQRERSVQVKAQSLLWKEEERTLQLIIHPELVYSCHSDNLRQEDQHLLLGCSVEVSIDFFSLKAKHRQFINSSDRFIRKLTRSSSTFPRVWNSHLFAIVTLVGKINNCMPHLDLC